MFNFSQGMCVLVEEQRDTQKQECVPRGGKRGVERSGRRNSLQGSLPAMLMSFTFHCGPNQVDNQNHLENPRHHF